MLTFDQIKNKGLVQKVTITLQSLPKSMEEMEELPENELENPFQTAALAICALCSCTVDFETGLDMLGKLKGYSLMSVYERNFLKERLERKSYLPYSYFAGASPENSYTPTEPYQVMMSTNPYSFAEHGYVRVFITSGGADAPRAVTIRQEDGKWMLWEYSSLIAGIRAPEKMSEEE